MESVTNNVIQRDVPHAIKLAIAANTPLMLHGPPGCAKSSIVKQTAKALKMSVYDIRLSQIDPVDLRGLPWVDKERQITNWAAAGFLPQDENEKAILFFDEINQGNNAQQAAAYELILDRRCGMYKLPDGVIPIAAGNRKEDFSIVNKMGGALRTRFSHITVVSDLESWVEWAIDNYVHESIIGFLRYMPEMLNEFVTTKDVDRRKALQDSNAIATERTWEYLSNMLKVGIPESIRLQTIEGTVGPAASVSFLAYYDYYQNLPDLDRALEDPNTLRIKENDPPEIKYAVASGLAARATDENAEKVFRCIVKLPSDFASMAITDALRRTRRITLIPEFTEWAWKNSNTLSGI